MAGSRLEKLGTVFSRVQGLMRTGALKEVDKPIWYDVYAAFPPRIEPKFDRFIQKEEPVNILYKEDAIRAKFYSIFGSPDVIDMRQNNCDCYSERFIKKYTELQSKSSDQHESLLFESVRESLKLEGLVLKTLADTEKEKAALRKAKEAQKKDVHNQESEQAVIHRLQKLNENQEGSDFVYDEALDLDEKQK